MRYTLTIILLLSATPVLAKPDGYPLHKESGQNKKCWKTIAAPYEAIVYNGCALKMTIARTNWLERYHP